MRRGRPVGQATFATAARPPKAILRLYPAAALGHNKFGLSRPEGRKVLFVARNLFRCPAFLHANGINSVLRRVILQKGPDCKKITLVATPLRPTMESQGSGIVWIVRMTYRIITAVVAFIVVVCIDLAVLLQAAERWGCQALLIVTVACAAIGVLVVRFALGKYGIEGLSGHQHVPLLRLRIQPGPQSGGFAVEPGRFSRGGRRRS